MEQNRKPFLLLKTMAIFDKYPDLSKGDMGVVSDTSSTVHVSGGLKIG